MGELDVFHFDGSRQSFEDFGQVNGAKLWYARDLMGFLGYESYATFKKAINKAISACTSLDIPVAENFIQTEREIDGQLVPDYKLSRFACYLTAMNGDVKKPGVAKAQAYFIAGAEAFRQYVQTAEGVERVMIREELSEREKSLNGVAHTAGVEVYGFFQNAGYRGMYNMDLSRLKEIKGVPQQRSLLDFMGKEELAANLFRITQTEARIRNEDIRGQRDLERTAHMVGLKVRHTMQELSGTLPEELLPSEDIKDVRRGLKRTQKEFAKLDKPQAAPPRKTKPSPNTE